MGESNGTVGIPQEVMEPLIPVSKVIAQRRNFGPKEDVVPTAKAEVSVSKESVALKEA